MSKKLLLYIFLSLFYASFYGQQPITIQLTEKDGLPDVEIYDLYEDDKGFIWIAADKGLFCYDGRNFKTYTHPKKIGKSLFNLKKDYKGRLWCNNLAGQFFYIENDKLHLYDALPKVNTLTDFFFVEKNIVFNKNLETIFFNLEKNKISNSLKKTESVLVSSKVEDGGNYYFKMADTIFKVSNSNTQKQFFFNTNIKNNFDRGLRILFSHYNKNYILIQSEKTIEKKIYEYQNNIKTPISYPKFLNDLYLSKIIEIDNLVYILSNKGVLECNIINNQLIVKNHYFKNIFVSDFIKDKNNNYWFSTLTEGIYVMPNPEIKIFNENDFGKVLLTSAQKDQKSLLIANKDGDFYKYNNTNRITDKLNFSSKTEVKAMFYNEKNESLVIGARNRSLYYNFKSKKYKDFKGSSWKSIDYIGDQKYLISKPNEFGELNISDLSFKVIQNKRAYYSIFDAEANNHYACLIDGFYKYDRNTNEGKYITKNNIKIYGSQLAKTADNTIWIATHNSGLLALKNDVFIDSLQIENGLSSYNINHLKADNDELWIATDKGLQLYNVVNQSFKTVTKNDGLNTYTISHISILDSLIFLTTNRGLISFNKKTIFKEKNIPKPYFKTVTVNGNYYDFTKKFNLNESDKNISISFNTTGFQSDNFVEYQYYLDGFSNHWTNIDAEIDFVNFNSLNAGNYTFKLRAFNKYDKNFSDELALQIIVSKPFYKTIYFFILIVFLLVFLMSLFFKNKNKRLQEKQRIALEKAEISKELVLSQLENLRSQMNPHFIFNALNSIQDFILQNEKKLARQYLVKFSRLIRTYLEHSQVNKISLKDEIDALQLYLELEKDRFNDDLDFMIKVDINLPTETIKIPSLFIQPYVENALKHGLLHKKENKKLRLNFYKKEQLLICEITDNGVGRKASTLLNQKKYKNHKSFATSANQRRISLLNKANEENLQVEIIDINKGNTATGTKVIIKIPLKK